MFKKPKSTNSLSNWKEFALRLKDQQVNSSSSQTQQLIVLSSESESDDDNVTLSRDRYESESDSELDPNLLVFSDEEIDPSQLISQRNDSSTFPSSSSSQTNFELPKDENKTRKQTVSSTSSKQHTIMNFKEFYHMLNVSTDGLNFIDKTNYLSSIQSSFLQNAKQHEKNSIMKRKYFNNIEVIVKSVIESMNSSKSSKEILNDLILNINKFYIDILRSSGIETISENLSNYMKVLISFLNVVVYKKHVIEAMFLSLMGRENNFNERNQIKNHVFLLEFLKKMNEQRIPKESQNFLFLKTVFEFTNVLFEMHYQLKSNIATKNAKLMSDHLYNQQLKDDRQNEFLDQKTEFYNLRVQNVIFKIIRKYKTFYSLIEILNDKTKKISPKTLKLLIKIYDVWSLDLSRSIQENDASKILLRHQIYEKFEFPPTVYDEKLLDIFDSDPSLIFPSIRNKTDFNDIIYRFLQKNAFKILQ